MILMHVHLCLGYFDWTVCTQSVYFQLWMITSQSLLMMHHICVSKVGCKISAQMETGSRGVFYAVSSPDTTDRLHEPTVFCIPFCVFLMKTDDAETDFQWKSKSSFSFFLSFLNFVHTTFTNTTIQISSIKQKRKEIIPGTYTIYEGFRYPYKLRSKWTNPITHSSLGKYSLISHIETRKCTNLELHLHIKLL